MREMIRLSPAEFDDLVVDALDTLPEPFRKRLENVIVATEDEPSRADRESVRLPRSHTLFGLYSGTPLTRRDANFAALPDRIVLFRGPILRACRTREEAEREVKNTVMHEIGHHFGLSDADLP